MTNKTKHTPAPWRYFVSSQACGATTNDSDIAHCSGLDSSRSDEEVKANAHLIAAAPELLEALNYIASLKTPERIQRDIDAMKGSLCPDYNQTITGIYKVMQNTAKAAIAKAEGKI